jgi:phage tail P2-like protein
MEASPMSNAVLDLVNADARQLLPEELTSDANVCALLAAVDEVIRTLAADTDAVCLLAKIDTVPEAILNELAWLFHADYYRPDVPLATKRCLVKQSVNFHRRAGTRAAVEAFLETVWGKDNITLQEWWETTPPLPPRTFKVTMRTGFTVELAQIVESLREIKRCGDWVHLASGQAVDATAPTLYLGVVGIAWKDYGTISAS